MYEIVNVIFSPPDRLYERQIINQKGSWRSAITINKMGQKQHHDAIIAPLSVSAEKRHSRYYRVDY